MTRPPTASERQRLRSFDNLWRALLPLVAVVGIVVIFTWPEGTHSDGVHVVDTVAPVAAARDTAGFAVAAPVGLSSAWRPTSTQYTPASADHGASFRIGFVTPANGYAEYLVSNDAALAVTAQWGPVTGSGSVDIGGVKWSKYVTAKNRTLLARTSGKVTAIVTGSASDAELQDLAGALRDPSGAPF